MEEKSIDELVAQNCEGGTFALETVKALDECNFRKEIFQAVEAVVEVLVLVEEEVMGAFMDQEDLGISFFW